MSSSTYSSKLKPDPRLRVYVATSGRILLAAGLVLILVQDFPVYVRVSGALLWALTGYWELRRIAAGFGRLASIRVFPDGTVEIGDVDGECFPARCAPGCIVLQKLAWLRLQSDDGGHFVELLRGDAHRSHDWRRLQVIWRFIGTQQ